MFLNNILIILFQVTVILNITFFFVFEILRFHLPIKIIVLNLYCAIKRLIDIKQNI